MMGVEQPVIGVLFSNGERLAQRPIQTDRPVMLETELGVPAQRIDNRCNKTLCCQLHRARCTDDRTGSTNLQQRPNAVDLIASNSATYGYITGNPFQADWRATDAASASADLDRLNISLFQQNDLLHAEVAGSIMQGQWHAVTWLINEVLAQGYTLSPEHLLMTGSVGALHLASPENTAANTVN